MSQAPFQSHLVELRKRLMIAALAVVATTIVAFIFHPWIIRFLLQPADSLTDIPGRLVFIDVTEMFGVAMKVSIMTGLVLALPVVLAQVMLFVAPGLTPREKRYLFAFLPAVLLAFAGRRRFRLPGGHPARHQLPGQLWRGYRRAPPFA